MSKSDFGQYIRKLRIDRDFSLRELACELDITPYYLSYIESGAKCNPNIKIIAKMFKVLNLTKKEIEVFFDLHAKANGCVSYDIVDYIMKHDEVREAIRSARDMPNASPSWEDFLNKFMNK